MNCTHLSVLTLGLASGQSLKKSKFCNIFIPCRHKTMWGWGGDKTEVVSGFECKVFTASGVEVLTKTRVEHLTAEDKQTAKSELCV